MRVEKHLENQVTGDPYFFFFFFLLKVLKNDSEDTVEIDEADESELRSC